MCVGWVARLLKKQGFFWVGVGGPLSLIHCLLVLFLAPSVSVWLIQVAQVAQASPEHLHSSVTCPRPATPVGLGFYC